MQWHSLSEFLAMGGYGFYVWGSVGACAVAMVAEPLILRGRHKSLVRSLRPLRGTPAGTTPRYAGNTTTVEGTR